MKKYLIALLIVVVVVVALAFLTLKISQANYNDGVCENCGGHYVYQDCGGGRWVVYIYKCDTCGHLIETNVLFDDVNNQ